MRKNTINKIQLPEFIRLSHYCIQILQINNHISYELAEQQGSFHSREMKIYVDETIIEKGKNEEDTVNGISTHYTEIEKNNPDYVRWKLQNLN